MSDRVKEINFIGNYLVSADVAGSSTKLNSCEMQLFKHPQNQIP